MTPDRIRAMRLEEIGNLVTGNAELIIERWYRLAKQDDPNHGVHHREELKNNLPQYLRALGDDLAQGRDLQSSVSPLWADTHGKQRWNRDWSLAQVVRDYQLLRVILLEFLDKSVSTSLTIKEATAVSMALDDAIAISVISFIGFQQQEQRERNRLQSHLAAIYETSSDGIISQDLDGTITNWNNGATQLYGYSSEEMIGQNIDRLVPAHRKQEAQQLLKQLTQGESVQQLDSSRLCRDGKEVPISLSGSALRDAEGNVVGVCTIERDVSRRVRTEHDLAQAMEDAEQANRAKSEFLANVSHELRTPMNAIIGMTELALEENLTPEVNDYLSTTRESADSLLTLLNDVLDISKLESGKFELENIPFSLRDTLDETLKSLALRTSEKGLELACHVPIEVPDNYVGDPTRLRQILTNLVSNAVKFTERGEVVVRAMVEKVAGSLATVVISVRDTGIGISQEDQARIFSPFSQVDSSPTRSHGGTGLGLSIASHLIELMNGEIWVESELGVGTTFYFKAQLALGSDRKNLRASASPPVVEKLRGLPVLVIDDNDTNLTIIDEYLQSWSMQPTLANSARSAIAQLQTAAAKGTPFPVIIVDALMPKTDGFEFLEHIRSFPDYSTTTIMMLSSADRMAFSERCREVPIDHFLEKPVSQSHLLDAMVTALGVAVMDPITTEREGAKGVSYGRSLNILVCEDTAANRKVVERVLTKRGHHVEAAHNGREAVERVRRENFDVVLMDVQMPIMDGYQATSAIRSAEADSDRHTPIIAMTAHAMPGDAERCLAAGMDAYLSKPIKFAQLLKTIRQLATRSIGATPVRKETLDLNQKKAGPTDNVDLDAARKRLGNDETLLAEMVDLFLEDYPELIEQCETALKQEDAATLQRTAHSLKGLAANFDAHPAKNSAFALEINASKSDFESAQAELGRLKQAFKELDGTLRPLGKRSSS